MTEEQEIIELKEKRRKAAKPMLWIGIVSIIMLFGGLTSAVIVSKSTAKWMTFTMPHAFLLSTIVIVISSFTLLFAQWSAKKNNYSATKYGVLATLILAVIFVFFQFVGYSELVEQGVYFTGSTSTASGSYLYILSWVHLLHLAGGIIALIVISINAFRNKYDNKNLLGLQLGSTYWHFLDVLWVYLYFFFKFLI